MSQILRKRFSVICSVIFVILLVFSSTSSFAKDEQKHGKNYYYFHDKLFQKTHSFKPKDREMMVSFSSEYTPAQMHQIAKDEKVTPIHIAEKKRFGVYKLAPSAVSRGDALSKMKKHLGVLSAIPVMVDQEGIERHFIPHEFTVHFKDGISENKMLEIIVAHGSRIIRRQRTPGYYTLAVPRGKMDLETSHGEALFEIIREFIALDEVKFAEPSYIVFNMLQAPFYPDDLKFPEQWNLDDIGQYDHLKNNPNIDSDINAPEAWNIEKGNSNVVIVVIDTGIDMNHDDLVQKLLPREAEDWDFSDGPSKIPHDVEGHGTCVAGIAAATTDNFYGVAGIAQGCKIMPLRVEFGYGYGQDYVDALNYVAEYGDKHPQYRYVVNCSWGGGGDSTSMHNALINVRSRNIFVCFASGNYNPFDPFDTPDIIYPARYNEVLAVGASSPCNEHKSLMSCDGQQWTSKYGPELDVVAPGVFIPSTDITGVGGYNDGGDFFDSFGGTSAACPHVAGLAALLLSKYRNMSAQDVGDTIKLNAKDIENPGWDIKTGQGKIDAFESLSNPTSFAKFDTNIQSAHPYQNDTNIVVGEIYHPGASAIRVHFSAFATERFFDDVILSDANNSYYGELYSGNLGSFTSYFIPGDRVRIRLVTDEIVTDNGFIVDYYECYMRNVYVDCNASDMGNNNGTSWEKAFLTIQGAIDDPDTINGSTIWVAEGTYLEAINFKGKSISLLSLTDPNKTIINANGSGTAVTLNCGEGSGTIISGFTVKGGNATNGGGIYCNYTSPKITNCIVKGNAAASYGGGIYCRFSSAEIYNCTISGNSVTNYHGGGFYCFYSPLKVENCTISGNSATTYNGGGFYCSYSNLDLDNCVITGNSAYNNGGGFFCVSSNLDLNGCTISLNTAPYGAGMITSNSSPSIINCIISGNSANYLGGGFFCSSCALNIINSTVYGNSAMRGGGLYVNGTPPTITNSILWNDSPQEIYGSAIVSYSDIQGGYAGTGNINADPLFVDLYGDYHLQENSPCKDAADPKANGLPLTDKDGNLRDPNYPDMGAYELMITHVFPGQSIQQAIDNAVDGSVIIVHQGEYVENINFRDRALTLRSTNPDDPAVISGTVINGNNNGCVVVFDGDVGNNDPGEGHKSVLSGFTLQNGSGIPVAPITTYGGAIFCIWASPSITKCRIILSAADYGGGIFCYEASPSISNCEITDNDSNLSGGGIYCYRCSPRISNCIIARNDALNGDGGGIVCNRSAAHIANCIIYGNTRHNNFHGSGILNAADSASDCPTVVNCILWHNQPNMDEIYNWNQNLHSNVDFSDVEVAQGVYLGQGNINANPQFVSELNNDFHLQNGSPCINAGTNAAAAYDYDYKVLSLDKDGIPRPVGAACDVGAYEFVGAIRHVPGEHATIQSAINASSNWDVIIVEPGTYKENINPSGKAITIMSIDPWDPEVVANTIIDGNKAGTVVTYNSGEGSNTALRGFTIQNGSSTAEGGGIICKNASSPTIDNCRIIENSGRSGGGVYCSSSSPSMTNCTITGNSVILYGSGVYCSSSSPSMTNCAITGNMAGYYGGGVYCYSSSSPNMTNCTITGNSAGYYGGGVYCQSSSSPSMINCTIIGNTTDYGGGGVYCSSSSPSMTNCTINSNTANNGGGGVYCYSSSPSMIDCTITGNNSVNRGGGVYCYSSSPSMTNCTITGNNAVNYGGGVYCQNSSSPIMANCTINENLATYGGGVYCYSSSPSMTNCTITRNISVNNGGGVYCYSSSPSMANCTITGNNAVNYGGGVYCYSSSSPSMTNCIINGNSVNNYSGGGIYSGYSSPIIMNCTIYGNSAPYPGGAIYFHNATLLSITNSILWNNLPNQISGSGTFTVTYSDIQGGYSGTGNINADPLFIHPGWDYHLQAGSPCIDSGTGNGAPLVDKDGVLRPQDGDGVGGAQWDMGAYEYVS